MSEIFHKSCYTSRSSGYKHRTLSTNTGESKRRGNRDDNAFERKFRELRKAIIVRVNKEVSATHKARESIIEKFGKIDAKVNSMLQLQDTVTALRKNLQDAGFTLAEIINKVDRIEAAHTRGELYSQQSQMTTFKSQEPIAEEEECDSVVTHV